ncbi:hypothetical protein Leryth_017902 [Lithospermum erythrorhizon]|nr:hypothetical protein Leryth_017902 [Lithospermum erythrorhizon]
MAISKMELNSLPLSLFHSSSKSSWYLQSRTLSKSNLHHHWSTSFQYRYRAKSKIVNAIGELKKEDIVIVGAGIAGLATAVSLQRLGIPSTVLEQAESLRTGGTSLTLFKNGWKVLDAIGVGSELRKQFLEIQGLNFRCLAENVYYVIQRF